MNLKLEDQLALVTASTGGIGLAIAAALAAEGAEVVVNGRSQKSVDAAMSSIYSAQPNAKLRSMAADNGTAEGCAATIAALPEVDVLVNNLGIYEPVGFFEETDEDWLRLFEVNILSGVRLSRHYLKQMLKQGQGRIIFIASESGINPAPEMAHYSATKTMQLSLSRCLAEMTKGTAVTVNAVLPGPTLTDGVRQFVQGVYPGLPEEEAQQTFMRQNRSSSLIERFIKPAEIGALVAFLAGKQAGAINGAALRADGGIVRSVF